MTLINDDKKAQQMIGRVCDDCQHLICGFDLPFAEKMHLMMLRPIKFERWLSIFFQIVCSCFVLPAVCSVINHYHLPTNRPEPKDKVRPLQAELCQSYFLINEPSPLNKSLSWIWFLSVGCSVLRNRTKSAFLLFQSRFVYHQARHPFTLTLSTLRRLTHAFYVTRPNKWKGKAARSLTSDGFLAMHNTAEKFVAT